MARLVAGWLIVAALAGTAPTGAHGPRHGAAVDRPHRGHPINAWLGSRRLRLR